MELSDKDILRKYISGNYTSQELERVQAIMQSPGYPALMEELLHEESNPIQAGDAGVTSIHMQHWLEKIDRRIADVQQEQLYPKRRIPFYLRYAAVWLLAIGMGVWGVRHFSQPRQEAVSQVWKEQYTPKGKRIRITLPDSSIVTLAADSRLRFPDSFKDSTRTIFLEGEAFFEVACNPDKPFIVHTADIQTRVLGTSFRITTFAGSTTVAVATGKVSVDQMEAEQQQSLAILTAGQQLSYANGKSELTSVLVDELTSWKNGQLVYTGKPLKRITDDLGRWYNKTITYQNSGKASIPMDISINTGLSIEKIMKVLAASGGFTYKMDRDTIIIY